MESPIQDKSYGDFFGDFSRLNNLAPLSPLSPFTESRSINANSPPFAPPCSPTPLLHRYHVPNDAPISYKFIDEEGEALTQAIQEIATCPVVSVDCEGVELGRHGELCLIQVATDSNVFLFDVIALGEVLFNAGLKRIFEGPIPTKVFYDCRRDSDVLYHQFGVKLKGVLDAALTEVFFRWRNRQGIPRFLKGYKRSVETYMALNDPHFAQLKERISSQMSDEGTECWKQRPLNKDLLEYAAYDVKYLRILHFVLTQHMSKRNLRLIYGASTKFIRMERDTVENIYEKNAITWSQITFNMLFEIKW